MANLEGVAGFYTSISQSGITEDWVMRMRGKRSALGRAYRNAVVRSVGRIDLSDEIITLSEAYPLYKKSQSYMSSSPTLNNLDQNEINLVTHSQEVIEAGQDMDDVRESVQIFARDAQFTMRDATQLKLIFAREAEINRIRRDIHSFTEASHSLSDQFSEEVMTGRFILENSPEKTPIQLPLNFVDFDSIGYQFPEDISSADVHTKAAIIRNYLVHLTSLYNDETHLTPQFLEDLQNQITHQLEAGRPLTFSIYVSLEKFANPFDTKNSHIDIGEVQMVSEMSEFLTALHKITGQKPNIVIMNESPNNQDITNASTSVYLTEFQHLLDMANIREQVHIIPFDSSLFRTYLQRIDSKILSQYGINFSNDQLLTTLSDTSSDVLIRQIHSYLEQAYQGIISHQITLSSDGAELARAHSTTTLLPTVLKTQLDQYIAKNFHLIKSEGQQSVSTELKRSIDPSILSPVMSESLWHAVLRNAPVSPSLQPIADRLRNYATEQAKIQGLSFRAFMRMRDVFSSFFGVPFMQHAVQSRGISSETPISLSITSNDNKLSWQLGRFAQTNIYVGGKEIRGVSPEHGVGVFVNGRIVSIHWNIIQKNPEYFRPITLSIKGYEVKGYSYVADAILVDIDGTIKQSHEQITEKVWESVVKTLLAGKTFGFSTGRSFESVNRDVYAELRKYLHERNIVLTQEQQNLFFVSVNHGALQMTGIDKRIILYSQPIEINDLLKLEGNTTLIGKLLSAHKKIMRQKNSDNKHPYDGYSYYFRSNLIQELLQSIPELQNMSLTQVVDRINHDFSVNNSSLHVCQNSNGMDIVQKNIDKHLSLIMMRKELAKRKKKKVHSHSIVTIGDDPEANDRRLIKRPMGRSDITKLGPEKVVQYINLILGN